jgi:hypothetical protein
MLLRPWQKTQCLSPLFALMENIMQQWDRRVANPFPNCSGLHLKPLRLVINAVSSSDYLRLTAGVGSDLYARELAFSTARSQSILSGSRFLQLKSRGVHRVSLSYTPTERQEGLLKPPN